MTIFINNPPTVATCHIWHKIAGHGSDSFNNESQPWPGVATVYTVEKLMTSQNQFFRINGQIPTVATVIRTGHGWQNV